jgi:hypothetical protein
MIDDPGTSSSRSAANLPTSTKGRPSPCCAGSRGWAGRDGQRSGGGASMMLARVIATALIDSFRSRGKVSTRCYGEWSYLKGGTVWFAMRRRQGGEDECVALPVLLSHCQWKSLVFDFPRLNVHRQSRSARRLSVRKWRYVQSTATSSTVHVLRTLQVLYVAHRTSSRT